MSIAHGLPKITWEQAKARDFALLESCRKAVIEEMLRINPDRRSNRKFDEKVRARALNLFRVKISKVS